MKQDRCSTWSAKIGCDGFAASGAFQSFGSTKPSRRIACRICPVDTPSGAQRLLPTQRAFHLNAVFGFFAHVNVANGGLNILFAAIGGHEKHGAV